MRKIKKLLTILTLFVTISPMFVYAAPPTPPSGGMPPGNNSSSVTYSGKTTITKDTTKEGTTYSSTKGNQNALLVSGGTCTLNNITIKKSGNSNGDNADFYGTNAAVLVYKGATLNINKANITTNGSHANAVFAYEKGTININDSTINTTSNNSGGVMVTGGGILNANNLYVTTKGNSSAAIRSDRGGGTLTVNGGTYETNGQGSPVIYSTAKIIVNNAKLTSTSSEGVVVEGANSVKLNNVTLTDTNNTLNGNSETYKNIFLYQSMSGDADKGTAKFTAQNSNIITNKGDTIFVTNTTATITLENNIIKNTDGDFLRIQKGKWGNSGSNGGNVTMKLTNQQVEGNIVVDNISVLDLSISNNSVLKSSINKENKAKKISISLTEDSTLVLSNDTYIYSLENKKEDNSNIYLNGYKLYVDGKEINANEDTYKEETKKDDQTSTNNNKKTLVTVSSPIIVAIVIAAAALIFKIRKNSKTSIK